jgi:Mitochondrial carrier protein
MCTPAPPHPMRCCLQCGILPYAGVDICLFEVLKNRLLERYDGEPPHLAIVVTGMASSSVAQFVSYPLALVRTRLQAQGVGGRPVKYRGMWDVITQTWIKEGITGFYKVRSSSSLPRRARSAAPLVQLRGCRQLCVQERPTRMRAHRHTCIPACLPAGMSTLTPLCHAAAASPLLPLLLMRLTLLPLPLLLLLLPGTVAQSDQVGTCSRHKLVCIRRNQDAAGGGPPQLALVTTVSHHRRANPCTAQRASAAARRVVSAGHAAHACCGS